jgi:hypothetical protein
MRLRVTVICALVAVLVGPSAAQAAWSSSGSGFGNAKAQSVQAGAVPMVSVSGRNVTVSWAQATLSGGGAISSYQIKRYAASTGTQQTIAAACAGTIAALTCTENAVPAGSWKYSVTPTCAGWAGAESPRSATATVAAPSLSLSGSTMLTTLPGTLNGAVASFVTGETLTFRLDNASTGQVLTGTASPSTIGAAGTSNISITVPSGTANGSHTLYAVGSSGSVASAPFTVSVDTTNPSVSAATIGKSEGGIVAFLRQGGGYYVYANVSDPGSPSSGIASVTANVSTVTSGQTAVTLSAGSYTAGGVSYNYRSGSLKAANPLAAGSYSFSVKATDGAGNTTTSTGLTVTVDNTAPTASDVQAANAGSQTGLPETADTITYTYVEALDPHSIFAGWLGTSTPVTVRFVDGGGVNNDLIQIWNSTNTAQLPLGQINLGASNYVTANATFTSSAMVQTSGSITITLGTPAGTFARGTPAIMIWTPSPAAFDRAANPGSTTPVTETGGVDRDF